MLTVCHLEAAPAGTLDLVPPTYPGGLPGRDAGRPKEGAEQRSVSGSSKPRDPTRPARHLLAFTFQVCYRLCHICVQWSSQQDARGMFSHSQLLSNYHSEISSAMPADSDDEYDFNILHDNSICCHDHHQYDELRVLYN